ncbi:MAG: class I SAM-dependent methyltransferase [Acidimicrobiia bacterium]|nr:class I SAM-dependent methyltransferase [Acidimicrobiia bacterium]
MSDSDRIIAIGRACGVTLDARQVEQLLDFRSLLASEGIQTGGIGPNEANRLIDRHIGDSLAYLLGIREGAGAILDIGSGIGLPGIPLAVARPDESVVLLDRSQRRSDVAKRGVRLLGLQNVTTRTQEIAEVRERYPVLTFRASLPVPEAALVASRLLEPGGSAVFGLSRRRKMPEVPDPPEGVRFDVSCELDGILDSPFWLLRMTTT